MAADDKRPFDVLVSGGSFAGLALALTLARAAGGDLRLALVERTGLTAGAPKADGRAFALAAGSRRLLESLGVWSRLEPYAQPVSGIDITDSALGDAMRPVLLSYETQVGEQPQMFILETWRLRQALVEAVLAEPALQIIAPADVHGLDRQPGWLDLVLADGQAWGGRLVVAADGGRSVLRAAAGIGVVGGPYRQHGIATIVAHDRPHEGRAVQHFLPAGPFAMLPLPGQRSCITWTEADAGARRIMGLDDVAFLAEAQQRAGWRRGALQLDGGRAAWPLFGQLARSLVAPRLALIGDAVRSVHPIAGQGVNLGFRDVAALAEVVVDGMRLGLDPGDATILDRYERWRRADGVQAAAAFSGLNALFSNDSSLLRGVRDVGLGLVDRLPGLKQLLVAEAAGATGDVPRLLNGEPL